MKPEDFEERDFKAGEKCPHCGGTTQFIAELILPEAKIREIVDEAMKDFRWQTMETAPENGTRVILYCVDPWFGVFVGYYKADMGWWLRGDEVKTTPTHWMPLPETPHSRNVS